MLLSVYKLLYNILTKEREVSKVYNCQVTTGYLKQSILDPL